MRGRTAFLAAAAVLLAVSGVQGGKAASLSCEKAKRPAEYTICTGWRLQQLDRQMSRKFYALVERAPRDWTYRLRHEQQRWVMRRNACTYDRACLRKEYRTRIRELNRWASKFGFDI